MREWVADRSTHDGPVPDAGEHRPRPARTIAQARGRLSATLDSLDSMEYHAGSGQFYNWYDPETRRPTWPPTAEAPGVKLISSVDNGWLATALIMVKNAGGVIGAPLAQQADRLYQRMNFGFYYDQARDLLRNGAWTTRPDPDRWPTVEDRGVWWKAGGQPLRPGVYGELNTEPRMAAHIAIARGQVPRTLYFRLLRTPPPPTPARR